MTIDYNKSPFPWFGGKTRAAPLVWDLLGDPHHYVEPFAGGLGCLLNRPHKPNRTYFSETVNDIDGLLVNAWRAIRTQPEATAEAASNPVAEADLHARHVALIRWREERQLEHLMGDPEWCDPRMAGWWLWGICCWIGGQWCQSDHGPWWPDEDDRLTKWAKGDPDRPGVVRQRPHIIGGGQGVNRPQLREPGVKHSRPHLIGGQGVNQPQLREPGVRRKRPHLSDDGQGVNRPQLREPGTEWHDVVMPELVNWFGWLSARLRHVRICNGDWKRVCSTGAVLTLPVRQGNGHAAVFLDPPYSAEAGRDNVLYGQSEDLQVAHQVRDWCLEWGQRDNVRIVLAGFDGEGHEELEAHGWTVHEWFTAGYLVGGYGSGSNGDHQQHRERLWASPACVKATDTQLGLFQSA